MFPRRDGKMRRQRLSIGVLGSAVVLTGCGPAREARTQRVDPGTAARLGLTEDAQDPTQRDLGEGYYRWKEKPEPEGTLDPTSPRRRSVGGPDP